MDAVLRAAVIYMVVLLLIRITGRRTLAEMSPFDFVLLLVIGEATQQALLGQDYSITNAVIVVTSLLGIDLLMSLLKQKSSYFSKWVDGVPTVIVEDGQLLKDRMEKHRVDEDDILESARRLRGLERIDQVRFAVLEVNGEITVIPQ